MKDLKFRAWCDKDKIMYPESNVGLMIHFNGELNSIDSNGDIVGTYNTKQLTIMQYTGINDNSDCLVNDLDNDIELEDKEIYEEDIVRFSYEDEEHTGIVKFGVGSFIITSNTLPDGYIPISEITNTDREYSWIDGIVVGNTYENPELISE